MLQVSLFPPNLAWQLAVGLGDAVIVAAYLLAVTLFGLWIGRGQRGSEDYFLGGRSLPWWAVLLSIVATETSTVTFLSIPGITYAAGGDFRFLQITFGYIVGRMAVIWLLLPLYFRGQPFTAYEVLERRFGKASRRATSALFLVTRTIGDALRLYLTALVLQQVVGLEIWLCVLLLGVLTIIYTVVGGVKSVVWNDCIQFVVYMVGAAAALWIMLSALPGGVEQAVEFARQHDKLRLFDFDLDPLKPTMTFWGGLIGGLFLTAATHGTDQLMVQRYLASRSQRGAGWALGLSGLLVCLQFAMFLAIGAALACFYAELTGEQLADEQPDRAFGHFIVHYLPWGLTGLTLAAVFSAAMSTLSSSLNSSATALINDLYVPLSGRTLDPATELRWGRRATIVFGILQVAIAIISEQLGAQTSIVKQVLGIAGLASGPVLGIYLLGVLLPRVRQGAALGGFLLGTLLLLTIALVTPLHWSWYAGVGAVSTFVAGWLISTFLPSHLQFLED